MFFGLVCLLIGLSICLIVSVVSQKIMDELLWKFWNRQALTQGRVHLLHYSLGMVCVQSQFFHFCLTLQITAEPGGAC